MNYKKTKYKIIFLAILFFGMFGLAGSSLAADYYVSPSGSDTNSGSINAPFKTIQKAADIVNPGDMVIVADGTYTDTDINGMIVRLTRSGTQNNYITFKSENKWGAILDGNNTAGQGFVVDNSASYINIYDFEITKCDGSGIGIGTDLPAAPNAYILVKGNYVHHMANYSSSSDYGQGGGFGTKNAHDITFDSNIGHHLGRTGPDNITFNKDHGMYIAGYGGGSTNIIITNNILYNCSGSAITMGGTNILVSNNILAWSNTNLSGGVQLLDIGVGGVTNSIIQNNIFYQPPGNSDGDLAIWFWYTYDLSTVTIRNNIVYEGTMFFDSYSSVVPIAKRPVMINNYCTRDCDNEEINPTFADVGNKDFHLQASSPAINIGLATSAPAYDFDGNLRTGNPDVGAYEYMGVPPVDIISPASPTGLTVL